MTTIAGTWAPASNKTVCRTSDKTLWVLGTDQAIHRSADNGVTWTSVSLAGLDDAAAAGFFALFVDLDDNAHLVYRWQSTSYELRYRRGTLTTDKSGWVWSAGATLPSSVWGQPPSPYEIVAFPSGDKTYVAISYTTGQYIQPMIQPVVVNSDGSFAFPQVIGLSGFSQACVGAPSIDFQHIGDAKTPTAQPALFVAWLANSTIGGALTFDRLPWTGSGWGTATNRSLDVPSTVSNPQLMFDGARCVVRYVDGTTFKVRERDAADTLTTVRTPPQPSSTSLPGGLTYDSNGNAYFYNVSSAGHQQRLVYTRATDTWGTWTDIEAVAATSAAVVRRGYYIASSLDAVWQDNASPRNTRYDRLYINNAPTAPTWMTADHPADVAQNHSETFVFHDPDQDDTGSSYAVKRIKSGVTNWLTSGGAWTATTEQKLAYPAGSTLQLWAANTVAAVDDPWALYVKTWDSSDVASPYSAGLTVTPSAKVNPTITAPTDGATITSASLTATGTAAEVTAYRWRLLTATGEQVESTGMLSATAVPAWTPTTVLANSTDYRVELTTGNAEGLASDPVTVTVHVAYTPPAQPSRTVSYDSTAATMTVTITNPAPSGSQPTVTGNDVYITATWPDGTTSEKRLATGITGAWTWYTPASGVDYLVRVVAVGDNGTSTST